MILLLSLGVWFWSLAIIEFCLLTWFVEEELVAASVISLILFVVGIWWLADIPVWTWIRDNPLTLMKYFIAYIVLGVGWSFWKYFFMLKESRRIIKEHLKKYENIPPEERAPWKEYLSRVTSYNSGISGTFEDSTKSLTFWAVFWVPSMVWTILNDPIRKLFNFIIHDLFIGVYQKMYNKMVGELLKDEDKK